MTLWRQYFDGSIVEQLVRVVVPVGSISISIQTFSKSKLVTCRNLSRQISSVKHIPLGVT